MTVIRILLGNDHSLVGHTEEVGLLTEVRETPHHIEFQEV